jgi:hypothetical protein
MLQTNIELRKGDVALAESALISFLDLDGSPSMNMSDVFRAHYVPPRPPSLMRNVLCASPADNYAPSFISSSRIFRRRTPLRLKEDPS